MDGLIYPAVVGAGLSVLLLQIIGGKTHGFWDGRVWLGLMTLALYCASYVAFAGREVYPVPAFFMDLVEVGLIVACFWSLGLLDAVPTDVQYRAFSEFLALDIVVVQPLWRLAMSGESGGPFHLWELRFLFLIVLAIGWIGPKTYFGVALSIIVLLVWYEFTPAWYLNRRNRISRSENH